MKKNVLLIVSILFFTIVNAQVVKFQVGPAYSYLNYEVEGIGIVQSEKSINSSFFVGMEYINRKYFDVSSNLGFVRKGEELIIHHAYPTGDVGVYLGSNQKYIAEYISFNTLIDIKYTIKESISPFISFGPRVDFMADTKYKDALENMDAFNPLIYGVVLGGGVKYDYRKLNVGLRAEYNLNFNPLAEGVLNNRTFTLSDKTLFVSLVLGYRLN